MAAMGSWHLTFIWKLKKALQRSSALSDLNDIPYHSSFRESSIFGALGGGS